MPFTRRDLDDLLRLLDAQPEFRQRLLHALLHREALDDLRRLLAAEPALRQQLLRAVLGDEMLDLPALVARLAAAQERTAEQLVTLTARVDELAAAQARTEAELATLTARVDTLTGRVDALTARVDELAAAQARTEAELATLTARVDTLTVRMDELTARVDALTVRVDELTARVDALTAQMEALTARVDTLTVRMDELAAAQARTAEQLATLAARLDQVVQRVDRQEQRISRDLQALKDRQVMETLRERPGLFWVVLEDPEVLPPAEVERWLGQLRGTGRIDREDYVELVRADLLVRGRRQGQEGYLVVEASWTIGPPDIGRARRRADLLRTRAGVTAWPAVAGYRRSEQAARLLAEDGVLDVPLGDADELDGDSTV